MIFKRLTKWQGGVQRRWWRRAYLFFTSTVSHISSLCCAPRPLNKWSPMIFVLCCQTSWKYLCSKFSLLQIPTPCFGSRWENFKMYGWILASKKIDITFLTLLIGLFGFSAVFSLAFNRTVYNCVYNQNPCHWTIASSCCSTLFKIVSIFLWHCHIVTLSLSTNTLWLIIRFPIWHQCGSLPETSGQGNLTISHLNICERTQQLFLRRLKNWDQKELWNIIKRQQAGQQNPPNSQRWPFLPPRIAHASQSHFSTSSWVLPPPFPLPSIPHHFPSLSIPPIFTRQACSPLIQLFFGFGSEWETRVVSLWAGGSEK